LQETENGRHVPCRAINHGVKFFGIGAAQIAFNAGASNVRHAEYLVPQPFS